MRIAICSDAYYLRSNTISNHIAVLEKGLRAFGHEVRIFTSDIDIRKTETTPEITAFPGKHTDSVYQQGTSLLSLRRVKRELNSYSPELIHVFSLNALGLTCARYAEKHHVPMLSTVFNFTDWFSEEHTSFIAPIKVFFYQKAARYILEKSEEILSFTPSAQKMLAELGIEKKIVSIPCCVDSDLFGPDTADPEKVQKFRMRFGLDSDKVGVLYAGSLNNRKFLDELFETWAGSVRPADRMKLILAGPCSDPEELRELAKLRGVFTQVHYAGEIAHEDMASCYRACDASLCTTDGYSVHFSPLEAIACGLPALVPESSSNRFLIKDGVNGFIYHGNGELREILLNFVSLDATGKRLLRNLVCSTMKDMDPYKQADTAEAIYFGVVSQKQ